MPRRPWSPAMRTSQTDLKQFLERRESMVATPSPSKVRVEWPALLVESPASTTWLVSRKVEAERRQQEKREEENPWLAKKQVARPAVSLAEEVREGMLRAAGKGEEKTEKVMKIKERIPLPLCEEIPSVVEENNELDFEEEKDPAIDPVAQMKSGLVKSLRHWNQNICIPSAKENTQPWNPRSMVNQVRDGLLQAGEVKKTEVKSAPSCARTFPSPMEKLYTAMYSGPPRAWLLESKSTPALTSPTPTSPAPSLRDSLMNLEEGSASSMDQWMATQQDSTDRQSDASIVTLSTSDLVEDYDDFADMEQELNQWICKA